MALLRLVSPSFPRPITCSATPKDIDHMDHYGSFRPARDLAMDSGKYKGRKMGTLPSKYLKWVVKNMPLKARLAREVLADPVYRDRLEWEEMDRILRREKGMEEVAAKYGWDYRNTDAWSKFDHELLGTSWGGRIPRKNDSATPPDDSEEEERRKLWNLAWFKEQSLKATPDSSGEVASSPDVTVDEEGKDEDSGDSEEMRRLQERRGRRRERRKQILALSSKPAEETAAGGGDPEDSDSDEDNDQRGSRKTNGGRRRKIKGDEDESGSRKTNGGRRRKVKGSA